MTLVGILKILLSCEDDEAELSIQNFLYKMLLFGRDVCFILAVVFTVIAVFTNSQNNSRRVPPTKPFFNDGTWVDDYFAGELYYAILKAAKYDVIFLMLYAPWDADSQNARSEFETVCRYFHKKVYCAAVNCWQANGGCKALFENVAVYPLFLLDLRSIPSIRYNGEYVSPHMIQFLSSAIKPLKRIHSVQEFHTLHSTCDALVVSFVPGYKWYKRYYTASLRYLEHDPRRDICWAFVTDTKLASVMELPANSIKLYMWNETKIYDDVFEPMGIVKWVEENVDFLTQWIHLKNARSNLLSNLLESNPSVILFTPRNIFLENIPTYLLFKQAALEYKNCFENTTLNDDLPYMAKKSQEIIDDFHHWEHLCEERFVYMEDSYELFLESNSFKYASEGLLNVTNNLPKSKYSDTSRNSTLGMNLLYDERSPENLVLFHIREKCRWLKMSKKTYAYSFLRKKSRSPHFSNVQGAPSGLCGLNRTFNFFAVDSLLYSHFSKALGINLNNFKDQTAIVIINNKVEEAYVLSDQFDDKETLLKFMIDVSNRTVPRWLKSTKDQSLYPHRYRNPTNMSSNDFTVLELYSETFQSVVFDSSHHVIVYYYSPFCSYCQVSAYTFLSVAHLLENHTDLVFARIDGENNDLPWHLVPLSYPSIMVFPAKSKSESKQFPMSEELTVENLLEFVLTSVDVDIKIKFMINECQKYRRIEHRAAIKVYENCIDNVKNHCLQLINNLVANYNDMDANVSLSADFDDTADSLYNTLRLLKSVYLHLEST